MDYSVVAPPTQRWLLSVTEKLCTGITCRFYVVSKSYAFFFTLHSMGFPYKNNDPTPGVGLLKVHVLWFFPQPYGVLGRVSWIQIIFFSSHTTWFQKHSGYSIFQWPMFLGPHPPNHKALCVQNKTKPLRRFEKEQGENKGNDHP